MKTAKKKGFSLVEIMVAMLLFAVLVLGTSAMLYQTGGGIRRIENKRAAIVAANLKMEEFWNMTYDQLGTVGTVDGAVSVNGRSMPFSVAVSAEAGDADGGLYREIAVSVDYMGGVTVDLVSRRSRRGLSKAVQ